MKDLTVTGEPGITTITLIIVQTIITVITTIITATTILITVITIIVIAITIIITGPDTVMDIGDFLLLMARVIVLFPGPVFRFILGEIPIIFITGVITDTMVDIMNQYFRPSVFA